MSIVFHRADIERLNGYMVYIFRAGSEVLYVGKGINISRPFNPGHHASIARSRADSLELIPCGTDDNALALESRLILELQPQYNHLNKQKKEYFKPRALTYRSVAIVKGVTVIPASGKRVIELYRPRADWWSDRATRG